jgi:dihydropyrimidinase
LETELDYGVDKVKLARGGTMEYDLVISGGTLVKGDTLVEMDLGISGGVIAAVGKELKGRKHLDAAGMLVIPGGIDPHVHLEMPTPVATSSDDWFTGRIR